MGNRGAEAAGAPEGFERSIVFVKAPRRGFVKTRIAAALGDDAALACYETLVRRVLGNLASLARVELRYTPDDAVGEVRAWRREGWTLASQGAGELGARLERAFGDHFAGGARRVVILGSDCPEADAADVRDAWRALCDHDLVLGPAVDGGYWLIGLTRPQPALFADIPWSTARVGRITLERARELGLRTARLRWLADVDTAQDWAVFRDRDGAAARAEKS
jgi:hypothetical protein